MPSAAAASLTKLGTGTLAVHRRQSEYATPARPSFDDGTLLLNKTAGVTAIAGAADHRQRRRLRVRDVVQVAAAEQISSSTHGDHGQHRRAAIAAASVATSTTQAEQP